MQNTLTDWFNGLQGRQGGEILAVQTLRNALMAASVLASAALVGLMGVLATAHLHPRWSAGSAALLLVVSAACAFRALWTLSSAGFDLRLDAKSAEPLSAPPAHNPSSSATNTAQVQLVHTLSVALHGIRWSGILMVSALAAASGGLFVR